MDEIEFDRAARRAERDRRRKKRILYRRIKLGAAALAVLGAAALLTLWLTGRGGEEPSADNADAFSVQSAPVQPVETQEPSPEVEPEPEPEALFRVTADTAPIRSDFPSSYAVLIDAETGDILAQQNSDMPVDPASMTKVLTLLVAVENIPDRTGTWTMTREVSEYCYVNKCSVVGFEVGETVPVEELFYGCIMNSGADACLALAELAAGSHEAFVELMNAKLAELGIDGTAHFTNSVGLPDEEHHCTMEDMALILKTALENEFCRKVLTCRTLMLSATEQHPDGQAMSNWFIRRIEDQDTGIVTVLSGKTGWVEESGFCAVSYAEDESGHGYLCATADSTGTWQSIYDHAELYRTYVT